MPNAAISRLKWDFEAEHLFERTYAVLAGDKAGHVDWQLFLRLAVGYFEWAPTGEELPQDPGEWVAEVSSFWPGGLGYQVGLALSARTDREPGRVVAFLQYCLVVNIPSVQRGFA